MFELTQLALPPLFVFAVAIFFGVIRLLRWRRSHSLTWPGELNYREQARICATYFRRCGIKVMPPPAILVRFYLHIHERPNSVLLTFAPNQAAIVATFLRDLSSSLLNRPMKSTIVVVVAGEVNVRLARWADDNGVAVLEQQQLPDLARLIRAKSPNLRAALLQTRPAPAEALLASEVQFS